MESGEDGVRLKLDVQGQRGGRILEVAGQGLAINDIDVKYATEIYDYVILHVFLQWKILELLCNLS